MAVDHGEKTLGLAVSDSMQIVANPLETVNRKKLKDDLKKITQHIEEYDIKGIIFGLPLNMDGSESDMSTRARKFVPHDLAALLVEPVGASMRAIQPSWLTQSLCQQCQLPL